METTGNYLLKGDVFIYDGETWKCTENNGFIVSADNVNKSSIRNCIMWIGGAEKNKITILR